MKRLGAWMAHPDPLVAAGNLIAVVLGYNTPLYPLFVWWLAGRDLAVRGLWAMWVFVPFMLVPSLARRSPVAARLLLVAAATANTVGCLFLYGAASGVFLFLIPCSALAALLFRVTERRAMAAAIAFPLAAYVWWRVGVGVPVDCAATAAGSALFGMNAASVGSISLFFGIVFSRLY
jgi:hypothetical protein